MPGGGELTPDETECTRNVTEANESQSGCALMIENKVKRYHKVYLYTTHSLTIDILFRENLPTYCYTHSPLYYLPCDNKIQTFIAITEIYCTPYLSR